MDGGLVKITRAGADGVFGTPDDRITELILSSDAIALYRQYNNIKLDILVPIPDTAVKIFQMDNLPASFLDTQVPIDQLVTYIEAQVPGITQADAVTQAQLFRGYSIKAAMDAVAALNARTAQTSNQIINEQLQYAQSILNPAFQTPFDKSVTQSFTQPVGTPSLYPTDTLSSILAGTNTGVPSLSPTNAGNQTLEQLTQPTVSTTVNPIIASGQSEPLAHAFQAPFDLAFGTLSYIDNTVTVNLDIKARTNFPVEQAKLFIQIFDQQTESEIKLDTIIIDTKAQSIERNYIIGDRIARTIRIEAYLWDTTNQPLANKIHSTTMWTPSTIGKQIPNPSDISKTVQVAITKNEMPIMLIIGGAAIVGVSWYLYKHRKQVKKEIVK